MKRLIAACMLIMGLAALVGCGTLKGTERGMTRAHQAAASEPGADTATLWELPFNRQGRINLGIASLDEHPTEFQLGGDDGATLNAYAACLTVKVSF